MPLEPAEVRGHLSGTAALNFTAMLWPARVGERSCRCYLANIDMVCDVHVATVWFNLRMV